MLRNSSQSSHVSAMGHRSKETRKRNILHTTTINERHFDVEYTAITVSYLDISPQETVNNVSIGTKMFSVHIQHKSVNCGVWKVEWLKRKHNSLVNYTLTTSKASSNYSCDFLFEHMIEYSS